MLAATGIAARVARRGEAKFDLLIRLVSVWERMGEFDPVAVNAVALRSQPSLPATAATGKLFQLRQDRWRVGLPQAQVLQRNLEGRSVRH